MTTKKVSVPQKLNQLAASDVSAALCYQIESAFGISASQIINCTTKMISNKDDKMMYFCIAAGVQIRGNVTFTAPNVGDIKAKYPELYIDSNRDAGDNIHYKGCHVVGHLLSNVTKNVKGAMVLKKSGDCVLGPKFPDTEAGKINKNIYDSWDAEDKESFAAFVKNLKDTEKSFVDSVFEKISSKARDAAAKMSSRPTPAKPSGSTGATPKKGTDKESEEEEEEVVDPSAPKPPTNLG